MAAHASSAAPAPVRQGSPLWTPAAARGDDSLEELANATCALCGIQLSIISLVPDGGHACADVRWYCRDIISCTERWTAGVARSAGLPPAPGEQAHVPGEQSPAPGEGAPAPGEQAPAAGEQAASGGQAAPGLQAPVGARAGADEQAGPPDDQAPVPGDAPVLAEAPGAGGIRAGQSGGGGRQGSG